MRLPEHTERKEEKAMLARFDHHPMLTALLALSTAVLVVVVITLSTLLITSAPPEATSNTNGGDNPGAAAAPANLDAGGENYGSDIQPKPAEPAQSDDALARHAEMVAAYNAKKP
jgi:hypothetical protein